MLLKEVDMQENLQHTSAGISAVQNTGMNSSSSFSGVRLCMADAILD